jgi:hypothetical protein
MAIRDRNLSVGTKLYARYEGLTYHAEVVGQKGKTLYQLDDVREFKSRLAAATAITAKACNGWAFWSVGDGSEGRIQLDDHAGAEARAEAPSRSQDPGGGNATRQRRPGWRRGARRRAPSHGAGRRASDLRRVPRDVPQRRRCDRALLRDARQAGGDEPSAQPA